MIKSLAFGSVITSITVVAAIYSQDYFKQELYTERFDLSLLQANMTVSPQSGFGTRDLENITNFGGHISIADGHVFSGGLCKGQLHNIVPAKAIDLYVIATNLDIADTADEIEYQASVVATGSSDFIHQKGAKLSDEIVLSLKFAYDELLNCHIEMAKRAPLSELRDA